MTNFHFSVHLQGKLASWNFIMGLGQSLPLTVIILTRRYCSISCYKTEGIKHTWPAESRKHFVTNTCKGGACTHYVTPHVDTYHRPPGHIGMLLIEILLKLGQLVQVPVFLPKPVPGVAELSSATSTVATKAGRPAAIAETTSPSFLKIWVHSNRSNSY